MGLNVRHSVYFCHWFGGKDSNSLVNGDLRTATTAILWVKHERCHLITGTFPNFQFRDRDMKEDANVLYCTVAIPVCHPAVFANLGVESLLHTKAILFVSLALHVHCNNPCSPTEVLAFFVTQWWRETWYGIVDALLASCFPPN